MRFAAASLTVLTLGACGVASAVASPRAVRIGVAPALPSGAQTIGTTAAGKSLQLTVALKSQDPDGLARFAEEVSTPSSPRFRQYVTVAQFASDYGAAPEQVALVRSTLQARGLTVGQASANDLLLPVSGTAGQVENALSVSLTQVKLKSGRTAYANAQAPAIPAGIAGIVQGVIGLDNVSLDQPQQVKLAKPSANIASNSNAVGAQIVTGGPQPCLQASEAEQSQGGYTADKIASAYQLSSLYSSGDLGAGQTIALFEQQPFNPADIATYQECFGTSAAVTPVNVDGGPEGPVSSDVESALDIEQLIGLAPRANVLVYQGPGNQNRAPADIISTIVSEDRAKVISSSWGLCEALSNPTVIAAENTLLQEAAAQGQSFFISSGDTGSEQCAQVPTKPVDHSLAVLNPAGQPFATGVGGTALYSVNGSSLELYDGTLPPTEAVWNKGFTGGASGGGVSEKFAMPRYQSSAPSALGVVGVGSSGAPCASASLCREVPDVSADADPETGYVVFDEGAWTVFGGTSASAPLWAAFTGLANALPECAGVPIGFANPALYSIAGSRYSSNFVDVIEPSLSMPRHPDNNPEEGTGLYPVGAGFDMGTGIGTPIGPQLATSLCAQARFVPEAPQPETPPAPAAQPAPLVTPSPSQSSSVPATISSAQVAALLAAQLIPPARSARIAVLLKAGGLSLTFKAPEAGSVTIAWYELPPGAELAKKGKPKPMLVAIGRVKFTAAGAKTLELKLTAAGKALLRRGKRVKLTAKGTFTPADKTPVSATKTFVLKR